MSVDMQDQLYDIYDLWYQPWYENKWYFSLAMIAGLLVLIALIFFVRFLFGNKKRKKTWQDRLSEVLNQAETSRDIDIKQSYFFLTRAIRLYLSHKYGLKVMHLTDLQMQNVLERSLKEQYTKGLKGVFERGLQYKFQILEQTELEKRDHVVLFDRDMEFVRGFIRDTISQDNTEV